MKNTIKKLIIAGGGTGGHIFCGLALAQEWRRRGGEVLFVGAQRGMEKDLVPQNGYPITLLNIQPLKGRSFFSRIKSLLLLPLALISALRILFSFKPEAVIGIGGYASGPLVVAAWMMGKKTAVVDQNSIPGATNRLLGKIVDKVFLTFDESKKFFKKEKAHLFGNPVMKERIPENVSLNSENIILVCGGSQGAHAVNEMMTKAALLLKEKNLNFKIIHQTGETDFEAVRQKYQSAGISAEVYPFIKKMDEMYRKARLIVSRSGAGTLTEIAHWGLPSILIPYPHAADNHQYYNAKHFEDHKAARILNQKDLTATQLAEQIYLILTSKEDIVSMSKAAKQLAKPKAAQDIVAELYV